LTVGLACLTVSYQWAFTCWKVETDVFKFNFLNYDILECV